MHWAFHFSNNLITCMSVRKWFSLSMLFFRSKLMELKSSKTKFTLMSSMMIQHNRFICTLNLPSVPKKMAKGAKEMENMPFSIIFSVFHSKIIAHYLPTSNRRSTIWYFSFPKQMHVSNKAHYWEHILDRKTIHDNDIDQLSPFFSSPIFFPHRFECVFFFVCSENAWTKNN